MVLASGGVIMGDNPWVVSFSAIVLDMHFTGVRKARSARISPADCAADSTTKPVARVGPT